MITAFPFNSLAVENNGKNYIILGFSCMDNPRMFDPFYIQVVLDSDKISMVPINSDDDVFPKLNYALSEYLKTAPEKFGIMFTHD